MFNNLLAPQAESPDSCLKIDILINYVRLLVFSLIAIMSPSYIYGIFNHYLCYFVPNEIRIIIYVYHVFFLNENCKVILKKENENCKVIYIDYSLLKFCCYLNLFTHYCPNF